MDLSSDGSAETRARYDSRMSKEWSRVDEYINHTFGHHTAAFEEAIKATVDAGMPQIQIAPNQGMFLYLLARMCGAQRILEIGTLAGYSAMWLARAGHVVTLELEEKHANVARSNLERAGVADRVEIIVGPALESLRRLRGHFDFIFIDADKSGYPDYLEASLKLARPGTVIVADNIVRDGKVADASTNDANVKGVRRYNELLANDARLEATVLQTVGSKGYDGFAIARMK